MRGRAKQIGLPLAICIVASNMIGSGIFLLPAALATVGSGSLLAWGLAAAAAMMLALIYARLAIIRPDNEGLVEYPRTAFHPIFGFLSWAGYWLSCWGGNIAILLAAIGYFKASDPADFDLVVPSPGVPRERYAERARRDATVWTLVQGILAPVQFAVFLVSLGLVLRFLVTGEGYGAATASILVKTGVLYAIMVTATSSPPPSSGRTFSPWR